MLTSDDDLNGVAYSLDDTIKSPLHSLRTRSTQ